MKKLQLNVDALKVDSFSCTADGEEKRGTVHARQDNLSLYCTGQTCQASCDTCTVDGNSCSGANVCFCGP